MINEGLEKIEKPAGISNPKDFRHEVVNFVLHSRAMHKRRLIVPILTASTLTQWFLG